jgi:hypothetical protein
MKYLPRFLPIVPIIAALTFAAPAQANEGWDAVSELYDDGGWSGGTMNRPAMTQLLGDVKAG